jgi:Rrf2 family nitric oxide-sensitive transcriptional repressor
MCKVKEIIIMQLNITTDYAIRTVLFLAIKGTNVASNEIATTMGIPTHYILKITTKLTDGGLLQRFRGIKGGFALAKKPEEINLYDIINLFEPTLKLNRCLEEDKYCSRFATDNCPVRSFYINLQSVWEKNLHSISILDLMNK